jgi:5-methylcytosine-specific restriction endonuclease McrA
MYKDPEDRKAYQREYQRKWLKARRSEWLNKNGPCKKCGSWENLEVDHINSATKITSAVWSWAEDKRNEELAKCQVLCEKCHLEKTLRERRKADHGNGQMYQKYKCRCDKCKKWKLDSGREFNKTRNKSGKLIG